MDLETDANPLEQLFQDFWKKIEPLNTLLKKKDIRNIYKDYRPLTKVELEFLFKRYNENIISYCLSPRSDNLDDSQAEEIRTAISRAAADGKLTEDMSRIDQIRIVMKYKNNICYVCKELASFLCTCKSIRYCSKACQISDWKNHREVCTAKKK